MTILTRDFQRWTAEHTKLESQLKALQSQLEKNPGDEGLKTSITKITAEMEDIQSKLIPKHQAIQDVQNKIDAVKNNLVTLQNDVNNERQTEFLDKVCPTTPSGRKRRSTNLCTASTTKKSPGKASRRITPASRPRPVNQLRLNSVQASRHQQFKHLPMNSVPVSRPQPVNQLPPNSVPATRHQQFKHLPPNSVPVSKPQLVNQLQPNSVPGSELTGRKPSLINPGLQRAGDLSSLITRNIMPIMNPKPIVNQMRGVPLGVGQNPNLPKLAIPPAPIGSIRSGSFNIPTAPQLPPMNVPNIPKIHQPPPLPFIPINSNVPQLSKPPVIPNPNLGGGEIPGRIRAHSSVVIRKG